MARSVKWAIRLSICCSLLTQILFSFAEELPPQLKTSIPPAAWVHECDWITPTNEVAGDKSEGVRYLLYEKQDNPAEHERFIHVVRLMENATGVQDSGSLTFDFDPSYQQLILHRVQIHRNGKVLDKLNVAKIKIIQPESELDSDVFTGRKSVVVFVEDLRVGDVLEYAYTTRGANPALNGHYSARMMIQSDVPIDRQRLRLVWSLPKPLYLRADSVAVPAKKEPWNGGTEYQWDFTGLEAVSYEDSTPPDFDPNPSLEFTDFRTWADVVDWALPMYAVEKTNAPPELEELIAKWRNMKSDEVRARSALEFVQDELRYTGIELGPDSYRPTNPFDTFRLRYGDCKGKASLLCTILREMNIEAFPALVDSDGAAIDQRLPSPFAFDHAIVKMILDGKSIWVDPTVSNQGGDLWKRHISRFGKALVIQPGVTALESIPFPAPDDSEQHVTSTFNLSDYKAPTTLTVETAYLGDEADDNREYFARNNRKEVQKNYLNFYSHYYPGITEAAPMQVQDDRPADVMVVTEHYLIPNLWTTNTPEQKFETTFYGETLYNKLADPDVRVRKMPLAIQFPQKDEQDVIVHFPDNDWNLPNTNKDVEDGAFSFHVQRTYTNATLRLRYTCETKTNQIAVAQVAGYLRNRDKMSDMLDLPLYRTFSKAPVSPAAGINWLMVVVAWFGLIGTAAGCVWLWWFTRARLSADGGLAVPPLPEHARLQGLGGWLILVGIALCSGPFLRMFYLSGAWNGFFSQASWQLVAIPSGARYHPLYGPLLIFELLGNIGLLGLNILALCMFFARRKAFPRIYIGLLVCNVMFLLLDQIISGWIPSVSENPTDASDALLYRTVLATIIWGTYMIKSRRVKVTFVR